MASTSSEEDSVSVDAPSERFEKYGDARRRDVYRAWPPTNTDSYPIYKRYRRYRSGVEGVPEFVPSSGNEDEKTFDPAEGLLKEIWQQLADCKLALYSNRIRIKNQTSRLQQARQERDGADNEFMSLLRPLQLDSRVWSVTALTQIRQNFQRLQETRDVCQEHEVDLGKLEQHHRHMQTEMDLLQRRLINAIRDLEYTRASAHPQDIDIQSWDPTELNEVMEHESHTPQSEVLLGLVIDPTSQSSPLYRHLVAGLVLIAVRKRHRAELRAQMANLDHTMELRQTLKTEERMVAANLTGVQKQVELATRFCWEENTLPRGTPLEVIHSWYPGDYSIDFDLGHSPQEAADSEPRDFSILLSNTSYVLLEGSPIAVKSLNVLGDNPRRLLPAGPSSIISAEPETSIRTSLSEAKDTLNFVNRWLLQILMTSRYQIDVLLSCYEETHGTTVRDLGKWQRDVLSDWWENEAQEEMRALFQKDYVGSVELSGGSSSPPSWLSQAFLVQFEGEDSDISRSDYEMMDEQYEHSDEVGQTESQSALYDGLFADEQTMGHFSKAVGHTKGSNPPSMEAESL